ncbi:unnamed protein product [Rotaria sp. Silwood2]|nr:unnamed protein product [Rotaria sp. Silwood2]
MVAFWKATITVLVLYSVGKGVRRRRQTLDLGLDSISQNQLSPNFQTHNAQEQSSLQRNGQNEIILGKKDSRQYNLYRSYYGYGTLQGINYPYGSSGVGPYRYGYGEYGQYGQGSDRYASYYIQNTGSSDHDPGYNSVGYNNRPDSYPSNYYGGPTSLTKYSCNSNAQCGCSTQTAILTKIVGGEAAGSNTWGWTVSLIIRNSLCGGSIIAPSWILTAAHCVTGASARQITVYAGSNVKLTGSQILSVSAIINHPGYSSSGYVNDIALLQLSTPLNMTDPSVSAICLPSISSTTLSTGEWPSPGTTVVAVGWGVLSENGFSSSTLQQVTLQTVDHNLSMCSGVTNNWTVQLCASSPGKDTCQGDSGGPLMAFTSSQQWVLVGATSSGHGCARPNYAGSYTRIAAFQSWISSNTGGQFTNPTSSSLA